MLFGIFISIFDNLQSIFDIIIINFIVIFMTDIFLL